MAIQALLPQTNDGWRRGAGSRKQQMEVGIECDDNQFVFARVLEDLAVSGITHSEFADVRGLQPGLAQESSGGSR